MSWTNDQMARDLPKLRKYADDVRVENGRVHLTTKAWTLRHDGSSLALPRIEMILSPAITPLMKYLLPFRLWSHPAMPIGNSFSYFCFGEGNKRDYLRASQAGPFMAYCAIVGILQTITPEFGVVRRFRFPWLLCRLLCYFLLLALFITVIIFA